MSDKSVVERLLSNTPFALILGGAFLIFVAAAGGFPPLSIQVTEFGWRIALTIVGVIFAAIGLVVWWRENKTNQTIPTAQSPLTDANIEALGYTVKKVYFYGINRNFFNDLSFWASDKEVKGTDLEKVELATAEWVDNALKIQRQHNRFRWIVSIIKYKNTSVASTDRYIPADLDPAVENEFVRVIYFEFKARVENNAHAISVRLRNTGGYWLTRYGKSNNYVGRKIRVSDKTWEYYTGIVGPVKANEPCYLSLDIMPGPKGEGESLFIRDLKILEVRQQPDTIDITPKAS